MSIFFLATFCVHHSLDTYLKIYVGKFMLWTIQNNFRFVQFSHVFVYTTAKRQVRLCKLDVMYCHYVLALRAFLIESTMKQIIDRNTLRDTADDIQISSISGIVSLIYPSSLLNPVQSNNKKTKIVLHLEIYLIHTN